jgi:thiamine phosphate synthase YjbQ (UPF0047 family)
MHAHALFRGEARWFETKKRRELVLDLGPWQQIFYAEFDGRRRKRLVIKAMGE